MAEEPKKEYTHQLTCTSCNKAFTITNEESNNTKLNLPKMFCPNCGKKFVSLNSNAFTITQPSDKVKGKANIEASREAMRMAAEAKRIDHETGTDRSVRVSPPAGESGKESYEVPEKVIEQIGEKLKPLTEE